MEQHTTDWQLGYAEQALKSIIKEASRHEDAVSRQYILDIAREAVGKIAHYQRIANCAKCSGGLVRGPHSPDCPMAPERTS